MALQKRQAKRAAAVAEGVAKILDGMRCHNSNTPTYVIYAKAAVASGMLQSGRREVCQVALSSETLEQLKSGIAAAAAKAAAKVTAAKAAEAAEAAALTLTLRIEEPQFNHGAPVVRALSATELYDLAEP